MTTGSSSPSRTTWLPLIETLQYDTIYHEHLRYYSLQSLKYLLEMHGLEVIHAKRIPTHGGSSRSATRARTSSSRKRPHRCSRHCGPQQPEADEISHGRQ